MLFRSQSTLFYDEGKYIEISKLKEKFIGGEKESLKGVSYTTEGSTITVTHFHGNSASQKELASCLKSQNQAFRTFKPLLEIIQRSDQLSLNQYFNHATEVLQPLNQTLITTSHKRALDETDPVLQTSDNQVQNPSSTEDHEKEDSLPPALKKPRHETELK